MDPPQADVIHKRVFGNRIFILNRPTAYNALDLSMIRNMTPQLQAWNESDLCKVIILKATGNKAFCAGGDVKHVKRLCTLLGVINDMEQGEEQHAVKFFEEEYQLNHLIATLDKPFVSFLDGITMGGGVGLSVHAPFRVATENTVFAMPEAKIGFFPDVGGSFFLPRFDGEVGTYLALTGASLKGLDVFLSGVATHYVPSQRLPLLENRLSEIECDDHEVINAVIEEFVAECNRDHSYALGGNVRKSIDRCFKGDSVEDILKALEQENSAWSRETINTLLRMSPTSLKVALKQLRKGKNMVITDCFKMEYRLAQKFLKKSDFARGVNHLLVNKEKTPPKWDPPSLEEVTDIEFYFDPHGTQELELLNIRSFENYPFSRFSLPSEEEIRRVVTGENMSKEDIVEFFLKDRKFKIGVREKVLEVLNRKAILLGGQEGLGWVKDERVFTNL
ncbi:3-hydroxyisobutyryl-coenzyme A hydrolase [Gigaspora rosea]|uniref:3-hydroxyisobutyryl-CoA hydrolase n=1 Tax=Gigaspora rosea TaxID=44941 RepID=A0A397UHS4_9GLOM|nr:3-hydroxyisobutyryl-coenzyme A hydrolase [Gigaspora rosea]